MANHLLKNTVYTLDLFLEINPSPIRAVPSSSMMFASGTDTDPDEKVKTSPNELLVKFHEPGVSSKFAVACKVPDSERFNSVEDWKSTETLSKSKLKPATDHNGSIGVFGGSKEKLENATGVRNGTDRSPTEPITYAAEMLNPVASPIPEPPVGVKMPLNPISPSIIGSAVAFDANNAEPKNIVKNRIKIFFMNLPLASLI